MTKNPLKERIIRKNLTKEEEIIIRKKYDLPRDWKEIKIKIKNKLFKTGNWNSPRELIDNLIEQIIPENLKIKNKKIVYQEKFIANKKDIKKINKRLKNKGLKQ